MNTKFKNQNLRDNMTDWELIFTMVGEKATTEITKDENKEGFEECRNAAQRGGKAAGNARKEIEKELGKSVVSDKNASGITKKLEKKKRKTLTSNNF